MKKVAFGFFLLLIFIIGFASVSSIENLYSDKVIAKKILESEYKKMIDEGPVFSSYFANFFDVKNSKINKILITKRTDNHIYGIAETTNDYEVNFCENGLAGDFIKSYKVKNYTQDEFNKLYETYGLNYLDITENQKYTFDITNLNGTWKLSNLKIETEFTLLKNLYTEDGEVVDLIKKPDSLR